MQSKCTQWSVLVPPSQSQFIASSTCFNFVCPFVSLCCILSEFFSTTFQFINSPYKYEILYFKDYSFFLFSRISNSSFFISDFISVTFVLQFLIFSEFFFKDWLIDWLIDWLLCWVFISVLGLSLVAASGGHSSSRCTGLSPSWPLLLRSTGSRCAGSVVVAHRPSCSAACGIFPDQGSNPCPLR